VVVGQHKKYFFAYKLQEEKKNKEPKVLLFKLELFKVKSTTLIRFLIKLQEQKQRRLM